MKKNNKANKDFSVNVVEICGMTGIILALTMLAFSAFIGYFIDTTTMLTILFGLLEGIVFMAFASYMNNK